MVLVHGLGQEGRLMTVVCWILAVSLPFTLLSQGEWRGAIIELSTLHVHVPLSSLAFTVVLSS